MIEVVVTTGAVRRAKLQSYHNSSPPIHQLYKKQCLSSNVSAVGVFHRILM